MCWRVCGVAVGRGRLPATHHAPRSMGTTTDDPMVQAMALSMLPQDVVAAMQVPDTDTAPGGAAEPDAPPSFPQPPTALPARPPTHVLSPFTFLKTELPQFLPNLLCTSPEAAVAQEGARTYFATMLQAGAAQLFNYPKNWRFKADSPEIKLVTCVGGCSRVC